MKRCDLDRAVKVMESNGYNLEYAKNKNGHHYDYSKDKISFELHWRLEIIDDEDDKLLSLFEEGIDNRVFRQIDYYCFPTLPPVLNSLVMIFHINQHICFGLGLRQIVDWMIYVRTISADKWTELLVLLKSMDMERFDLKSQSC